MAQLAASPSVQGPALYVPETHEGTLTQQGPSARARCPLDTSLGHTLNQAPWPWGHRWRVPRTPLVSP